MRTVLDIFAYWDTVAEMALDLGESRWTVQKWKTRGRIPSDAWPVLITSLRRKGKHVSADVLLSLHGNAPRRASGE